MDIKKRICQNCGAEIPFEKPFCGKCGLKYVEPAKKVVYQAQFQDDQGDNEQLKSRGGVFTLFKYAFGIAVILVLVWFLGGRNIFNKFSLIATTKELKAGNVLQIGNSKVQTIEGIIAAVFIRLGTGGTVATLKNEMKWKIEGSRGKDQSVVLVTYKEAEARILVEKQGDYVMIKNLITDIEIEYKNQRYGIEQFISM
jgi:ribosomal protein L40E